MLASAAIPVALNLMPAAAAAAAANEHFVAHTPAALHSPRLAFSPQQKTSASGLKGKALEAAGGGARWDALMEEAKPAGGLGFGGGGGGGIGEGPPSSSLRPLALHCAEQWSGRFRPECLEVIYKDTSK